MNKKDLDRLFEELDKTMNIYTPIGSKVIFSFPDNGMKYEQERAKEYLEVNKEYTVERIEIGSWKTEVFLKEVHDIPFNSILFKNKEE
jgi:hypothetical protein